jgi:hypothetical protein
MQWCCIWCVYVIFLFSYYGGLLYACKQGAGVVIEDGAALAEYLDWALSAEMS